MFLDREFDIEYVHNKKKVKEIVLRWDRQKE